VPQKIKIKKTKIKFIWKHKIAEKVKATLAKMSYLGSNKIFNFKFYDRPLLNKTI
jgi:hypothetical protein